MRFPTKKIVITVLLAFLAVPIGGLAYHNSGYDGGFITGGPIGNSCLVPIYNTDFMFPPEGGQIVTIDGQLFFNRNYLPGCGGYAGTSSNAYYTTAHNVQYSTPYRSQFRQYSQNYDKDSRSRKDRCD